ncbi:hypothetical protein FF011L_02030 [Roseimaritima multifibrata]|uniref:Uncharacterized protein n=1 Tax=Roseimaritima multifibrata TaxID=1930274 RepID=A0A517M9A2_9BACT|nr:hypothetical protein FF011L_02030 [Roseimaritima multifibrata]
MRRNGIAIALWSGLLHGTAPPCRFTRQARSRVSPRLVLADLSASERRSYEERQCAGTASLLLFGPAYFMAQCPPVGLPDRHVVESLRDSCIWIFPPRRGGATRRQCAGTASLLLFGPAYVMAQRPPVGLPDRHVVESLRDSCLRIFPPRRGGATSNLTSNLCYMPDKLAWGRFRLAPHKTVTDKTDVPSERRQPSKRFARCEKTSL